MMNKLYKFILNTVQRIGIGVALCMAALLIVHFIGVLDVPLLLREFRQTFPNDNAVLIMLLWGLVTFTIGTLVLRK